MYLAVSRITLLFFCASLGVLPCDAQLYGGQQEERQAQGKQPTDLYYEAWLLCQESEKLASEQNYAQAILKGNMAERILARIVRDFPQWKENMVRERRKLLAEKIASYRQNQQNNPVSQASALRGTETDGSSSSAALPSLEELDAQRKKGMVPPNAVVPVSAPRPADPQMDLAQRADLYQQIQRLHQELQTVVKAYKEAQIKLEKTGKELEETRSRQQYYQKAYEELVTQVAGERKVSNEVIASLNDRLMKLESDYKVSEQRRTDAERAVDELGRKLSETEDMLADMTQQRDTLSEENRKIKAILDLNNPAKVKALLDQNLTLATQLKEAQDKLASLEASHVASEDQVAVNLKELDTVRGEIARLKGEMSNIYAENLGYRRRISDQNTRLNNLEAELEAAATNPKIDPAALEENKLLREIIEKQRKQLSSNEQARRMMIDAYKNLNGSSPLLEEVVKTFEEKSSLELTPAEKILVDTVAKLTEAPKVQPDMQETIGMLGKAVRDQLRIETLGASASDAYAGGRYEAAEQLYQTLLDKKPDHLAAQVNMGMIRMHRNDMEGAIDNFRKAIALSPEIATPYFLCGSAMYRSGQEQEAIGMFRKAIEYDPANAEAFFYLGNLESSQGNRSKALNYFACAVKLQPKLADAHYNMSRLYAEEKKIPEACRSYDKALAAGAAPDMAFFAFLEQHPDRGKAPEPEPDPDVKKIAQGDAPKHDSERKVEKKPLESRKPAMRRLQKKDGSIVDVAEKKKSDAGKPAARRRSR